MPPIRCQPLPALALLLTVGLASPVSTTAASQAPADGIPDPERATAGPQQEAGTPPGVHALEFLAGCWASERDGNGIVIEEIYTEPADNLMLGLSRYLRGDTVVTHEFTRIGPANPHQGPEAQESRSIFLLPYPGGTPSENAFRLTAAADGRAVFEAPEHDFPRRIIYTRADESTLIARIDDGSDEGRSMSWTMRAAACPGSR